MNHLTPRKREVCGHLCLGLESKEIGARLGISHRTIDEHRAVIFRKMGVRNAVQLVLAISCQTESAHASA